MWKRFVQVYQTLAVIILNIIILLIVLLMVSDVIVPIDFNHAEKNDLTQNNWRGIGINHPYSGTFDIDSYFFVDDDHIWQLWLEYDRLAAEGHWQVHPWTGMILRPFQGQYLNIDENGFRRTVASSEAAADKPPLQIWTFGGSTLFGWGLADDYTLPSRIQGLLQDQFHQHQVQVSNFGVPWYYSSQELALFVAHLRVLEPPDIVLFLDGLNEVQYLRDSNNQLPLISRLSLTWESQIAKFTQPDKQPWVTLNPSFPPSRIARQLGIQVLYEDMAWQGGKFAYLQPIAETIEANMTIAREHYQTNQRLITALAEEYGITPYFFLQPLPFWRDDPIYNNLRNELVQQNDNLYFYDITDTFDEINPETVLLVDKTHYSDVATFILARQISDIIVETYRGTSDDR